MISIIVAMANNNVIGKDNDFPWHISADLARFKKLTLGNVVIMGRKTFDPHLLKRLGKPLPGRTNIIITRDTNYKYPGLLVTHSLEAAIQKAGNKDIFIIGGEQIYKLALPVVDRIYITSISADINGDAFFPEIDYKVFKETARENHQKDDKNQYDYSFITLDRQSTD